MVQFNQYGQRIYGDQYNAEHMHFYQTGDDFADRDNQYTTQDIEENVAKIHKDTEKILEGQEMLHQEMSSVLEILSEEVEDVRQFPNPLKEPPFILPQHDIPEFTGREEELVYLEKALLCPDKTHMVGIVGVTGTGGMGKSMLAVHFAHKYRKEFSDGVIGLRVDGEVDIVAQKFASFMGVEINPKLQQSANEIMQTVFSKRRVLLILDNASDATVQSLYPDLSVSQCAVIVTTRNRGLLTNVSTCIDLSGFVLEETKKLLIHLIGEERVNAELEAVKNIHELVGGLPLAIRIIGGTLRDQIFTTLTEYAEWLRQEKQFLLEHLSDPDDPHLDVHASFSVSLRFLTKEQKRIFACLGACAPEDFGLTSAIVVSGQHELTVKNGIGRLLRLSLVNQGRSKERFNLHPLLSTFAENLAREEGLLEVAEQRYTDYFVEYIEARQAWSPVVVEKLQLEVDALLLTAKRLKKDLSKAVDFYLLLETLLVSIGYWSQALEMLDSLFKEAEKQNDSYYTAYCLLQQGQFLRLSTRYAQAEYILQEGERIALNVEELDKRLYLVAMMKNKLGALYREQGRLSEAEQALGESRSILVWTSQGGGLREAMVLNSLGSLYLAQGRLKEAEQVLSRSFEIHKKQKDMVRTSAVTITLGVLYRHMNQFEEAEKILIDALEIQRSIGNKSGISRSLNVLAKVYQDQGKIEKSKILLEESLQIARDLKLRKELVLAANFLGDALFKLNCMYESERILNEGLMVGMELNSDLHVAMILSSLGEVYQHQKRWEEAERAMKESVERREKIGDQKWKAITLYRLGGVYQDQKRWEEAERVLEESVKLHEKMGDQKWKAITLYKLGGIYQSQKRWKDAERMLKESAELREKMGDQKWKAITLHELGGVYQSQKRWEDAERVLKESAELREKVGDQKWKAITLYKLGGVYQDQKRWNEAEIMLKESAEIEKKWSIAIRQLMGLYALGKFYMGQKRWGDAEKVLIDHLIIREERIVYSLFISKDDIKAKITILRLLGKVYLEQDKIENARGKIAESLKICKKWKLENQAVLAQLVLGEIYQRQRNFEQAEEILSESLEISKKHEMKHHAILILYALEKTYTEQKKIKEANDVLNNILKVHCEGEDKLKIALLKITLAEKYRLKGQYNETEKLLKDSIELRRELKDKQGEAIALHKLGKLYISWKCRTREAKEVLNESLRLHEKLGNKQGMTSVLRTICGLYKSKKEYEEAEKILKECLNLSVQLKDEITTLQIWTSFRSLYSRWKKSEEREQVYIEETKTMERIISVRNKKIDDTVVMDCLRNLGIRYREEGSFSKAKEVLEECLEFYREQKNNQIVVVILKELAYVYHKADNLNQAVILLQESFDLCEKYKILKELGAIAQTLINMLIDLDIQEAQKYYQRALEIIPESNSLIRLMESFSEKFSGSLYKVDSDISVTKMDRGQQIRKSNNIEKVDLPDTKSEIEPMQLVVNNHQEEPRMYPSPSSLGISHQSQGIIFEFNPKRRFDFLREINGQMHFFQHNAIVDDQLLELLLHSSKGRLVAPIEVVFTAIPGSPKSVALNISRLHDIKEAFDQAVNYANEGDYERANVKIKRVLAQDPNYPNARELHATWREFARARGVPRGSTPYARAKRKQLIEKDLESAIELLHEAIQKHDTIESAIKDLAGLLMQVNRSEEAIEVLLEHRTKINDQQSVNSMLVDFYQKVGKYSQAVDLLGEMLTQIPTTEVSQKAQIQWRIGRCYLRMERYSEAESWFRKGLDLGESNKAAQRNLALCLLRLGRSDEAEALLRANLPDAQSIELLDAIVNASEAGLSVDITLFNTTVSTSWVAGYKMQKP